MEELDELRQAIEAGDYDQALAILDALDAMSRDDKITKMMSYMRVLLVHLIKQAVEQRSTRSWEDSIAESLDRIVMLNKCRNRICFLRSSVKGCASGIARHAA